MNDRELKLGLRQYIVLENQTPLLDSAKYNLQFTAYDRARNRSFFQAQELILYDISPPLVYMYYPLSNTYVNHLEVQVEASEVLASGQIILTDLSGTRDTLSPHIYQLPKKELQLGLHAALSKKNISDVSLEGSQLLVKRQVQKTPSGGSVTISLADVGITSSFFVPYDAERYQVNNNSNGTISTLDRSQVVLAADNSSVTINGLANVASTINVTVQKNVISQKTKILS